MIGIGLYWMAGIVIFSVLAGFFLKWIIEIWLSNREASIAAFSLLLGELPVSLIMEWNCDYIWITEKIGSVIGLVILWFLLFRRKGARA